MRGVVDEVVAVRGGLFESEAIMMATDQDETRLADTQAAQHIVADATTGTADEQPWVHSLLPADRRDATDDAHAQSSASPATRY